MTTPIIELEGVSKRFVKKLDASEKLARRLGAKVEEHTVHAVDSVDMAIKQGEVVGLVGESGCGKSTLGRCVAGVHSPSDGTIRYRGNDVTTLRGAEALGIWFFAVNAGLGLANSFSAAFSVVLFPHLCASQDQRKTLYRSLALALCVLSPIILLQSALAPVYVPLLLGAEWQQISPVVSVLCLAALPSVIWSAVAGWLRSENRAITELRVSTALAFALILNTAIMAPFGLMPVAIGYLLTSAALMLTASWVLLPRDHKTTERLGFQ